MTYADVDKKKKLELLDEDSGCFTEKLIRLSPNFNNKNTREFSDDEENNSPQLKKSRASSSSNKRKENKKTSSPYDLILVEDGSSSKLIPPYSVYMGKGIAVEVKEYRKCYYICFSKTVEGEIKNRFNIVIEQLPALKKAVEAISSYVKDYA